VEVGDSSAISAILTTRNFEGALSFPSGMAQTIRDWRTRPLDLLPGETVIRSGRAGGYESGYVAGTAGRLYLTNQRIVLAPDRYALFRPPTLTLSHDEIEYIYMPSKKKKWLAFGGQICLRTTVSCDYGYKRTKRPCFHFWTVRQTRKWLAAIREATSIPLRDQRPASP
jgi:hypothetical protein